MKYAVSCTKSPSRDGFICSLVDERGRTIDGEHFDIVYIEGGEATGTKSVTISKERVSCSAGMGEGGRILVCSNEKGMDWFEGVTPIPIE